MGNLNQNNSEKRTMEHKPIVGPNPPGVSKFWDPVHLEYPVRVAPGTEVSAHTRGYPPPRNPQVLVQSRHDTAVRGISEDVVENQANSAATRELGRTQSERDFGYRSPTVGVAERISRATPAPENLFICSGNKRMDAYPFKLDSHGCSEAFSSYRPPATASAIAKELEHYRNPYIMPERSESAPKAWGKESPIDIGADSFVKYLDPYVSTSHLEHRPFTTEHLERCSNTRDVVTYYTYADIPRVRGPRPCAEAWWRPRAAQARRPMSDRQQFRHDFRETRVHNRPDWTPTSFRTETADSFVRPSSRSESAIKFEDCSLKECFHRRAAALRPADVEEAVNKIYTTDSRDMNSGRPILAIVDQLVPKTTRKSS